MKVLYFDCFSGISGDMALGAMLDLGIEEKLLVAELQKLNVNGWELNVSRVNKNGITANYAVVTTKEDHHHRNFADIRDIILQSGIQDNAKKIALGIFGRIAEAEGKVHSSHPDDVHFHEVGALDSIIDIVGAAICIDWLRPDKILASVIQDGHGFVTCQHGKIPVPVPAVTEIFASAKVKFRQIDVPKELVTPTGAAIVAELAESFGPMPEWTITSTGYGAGRRNLEIPNVLRVIMGEVPETNETITIIETNIDDCTPEILAYTMEKILQHGAKDVYFTPIQMKKNRLGTKITVLCTQAELDDITHILFAQTTTAGLRIRHEQRRIMAREAVTIPTAYGDIAAKRLSLGNSVVKVIPEYESAKQAAEKHQVPLRNVYENRG